MSLLEQASSTSGPQITVANLREPIHIVTWRLLDYDGENLTYGGLQRWLLALIELLTANDHRVFVHQRANAPFERALQPGVTVIGHKSVARAHGTPLFNLKVHRHIPAGAPVIYMAEDVSYPTCRERSIVIQHGVWWDGELPALKRVVTEHMVRHAVRKTAGTICVDTNFINWFRARWPTADLDAKLHYIPNFIDPAAWGPQPEVPAADAEPDGRLTICFPRRSEPRRGIFLMAEVAPKLILRYPQVDFRFVVGSGNYTDEFEERMRFSGADPKRWPVGLLPFERMREAYEQSAIVVIPTICGEGTSLAAIEAMYFGCAIVSTWVGGLPNLIQNHHNGLLIAPRADALTDALVSLIENRDLRSRLATRAMRDVMPQYGIARWRSSVASVLSTSLQLNQEVSA